MTHYIDQVVKEIKEIPPVSGSTLSIVRLISEGDYNIKDLVKLIESDLTLAGRCLQVVNSAAFGLKSRVETIQRAVVLLGAKNVSGIALQTGLNDVFDLNLDGYQSTGEEFYRHSLRTAIAARLICGGILNSDKAEVAYAVGLLHDIGKIVISKFITEEHRNILDNMSEQSEKSFLEAEQDLFGIDHAAVGAQIAKAWSLPESFQAAIKHHHHPSQAPEELQTLTLAVHLADIFAMMVGMSTRLDSMAYSIDPIVDSHIQRNATWELKTFPKLLLDIDSEFAKITEDSEMAGGSGV